MSIILVDERIDPEEESSLKSLELRIIKCPLSSNLYPAVSGHPDMNLHITNSKKVIIQKDMNKAFLVELENNGIPFIFSKGNLKNYYPYDIILNGLSLGTLFLHNLKYTDEVLLDALKDKKLINIKQGYSKCSCAVVSENAVITSDISIRDQLIRENVEVLLLPPGDILLPGLSYGFIGGTCGLIDSNTLAFFGDLKYYKFGKEVLDFLKRHGVKALSLRKGPLIDRGSILKYD